MSDACTKCGSRPDELIARDPWPAALDPKRCDECRAVTSYRWEVEPGVFERRRIVR